MNEPYVLAVFTDGRRECIERTIPSFREMASYPPTRTYIFNDSPDPDYLQWLIYTFTGHDLTTGVVSPGERLGFAGIIDLAWSLLSQSDPRSLRFQIAPRRPPAPDYVFHLEDDFTFNKPVPVGDMIHVLQRFPELQQMALRRQPWNDREISFGGVVEADPADFEETMCICPDCIGDKRDLEPIRWLEHRRFFTTNPCVYRRSLTARGWPNVPHSEGVFTAQLFEDPAARCAYWGSRGSGEWVTHIGTERVGNGY